MKDTVRVVLWGAILESTILFPLDVIKSRVQFLQKTGHIQNKFVTVLQTMRQENFYMVFKSWFPFGCQLAAKYAFRLTSFDMLKNSYLPSSWSLPSRIFTAGIGCGVIESIFIVTPTEVVKTRLQIDKNLTLRSCLTNIVQNEGYLTFSKGGFATVLRQCTNQASTFLGMYYLKEYLWKNASLSSSQSFFSGFLAGAIGPLVNNGIDVVKTRRMASTKKINKYLFPHMFEIAQKEGISSLYSGVFLRIARTGLGQAILWTVINRFSPNILK